MEINEERKFVCLSEAWLKLPLDKKRALTILMELGAWQMNHPNDLLKLDRHFLEENNLGETYTGDWVNYFKAIEFLKSENLIGLDKRDGETFATVHDWPGYVTFGHEPEEGDVVWSFGFEK